MRTAELTTKLGNFKALQEFILDIMKDNGARKRDITETMLVFEALYNDMMECGGIGEDTDVRITADKSFGDITVSIGFEGSMYIPMSRQSGDYVEKRVMGAYADKIEHIYHSGYNSLYITATRHVSKTMMYCLVAFCLAMLLYAGVLASLSPEAKRDIFTGFVFPMEKLFTNAVLMVGAPVTFFSLLKNLTDAYIISEKGSGTRRLQRGTLVSSIISALLALLTGAILGSIITDYNIISGLRITGENFSFAEITESIIPPSIFEPFETMSPIPLIVVALLTR